jgi:hypothetical protein
MSRSFGILTLALLFCVAGLLPHPAAAQHGFMVVPVAEKTIERLPAGPLFWSIRSFPTLRQAQAAEGPTSLAAECAGKAWRFTLGPMGGSLPGSGKIVEIRPVPPIAAAKYSCVSIGRAPLQELRPRFIAIRAPKRSMCLRGS